MRKLHQQRLAKTAKRNRIIGNIDMEKSSGIRAVKPFKSHEKAGIKSPHAPR
jgi:hypothetical protein